MAHALELDEHLLLHIRVSVFFPPASGHIWPYRFSLSLSLSLSQSRPPSNPPAVSPFPPFSLAFYFKRALG